MTPDRLSVPAHFAAAGIKAGEYLQATKPQLESQMRPCYTVKTRVWACGILHTAGYNGELAVTMHCGKKIPFTPAHIIDELNRVTEQYYQTAGITLTDADKDQRYLDNRDVRRALAEMEEEGICKRTTPDGRLFRDLTQDEREKLPQGNTWIYFFFRPTNEDPERVRERFEAENQGPIPPPPSNTAAKILKFFNLKFDRERASTDASYLERIERGRLRAQEAFLAAFEEPAEEDGTISRSPEEEAKVDEEGTATWSPDGTATRSPEAVPPSLIERNIEIKTAAAAAVSKPVAPEEPEQQQQRYSFPITAKTIRDRDPGADSGLVKRVVAAVFKAVEQHRIPLGTDQANDQAIAAAVEESYNTYRGKQEHGPGLLIHRVPEIIVMWNKTEVA